MLWESVHSNLGSETTTIMLMTNVNIMKYKTTIMHLFTNTSGSLRASRMISCTREYSALSSLFLFPPFQNTTLRNLFSQGINGLQEGMSWALLKTLSLRQLLTQFNSPFADWEHELSNTQTILRNSFSFGQINTIFRAREAVYRHNPPPQPALSLLWACLLQTDWSTYT